MKVIVIKTDNTLEVKNINDELKDFHEIIDGYIEIVRPRAAYEEGLLLCNGYFICDEEGLLKGKAINILGTIIYNGLESNEISHPIVGDIIVSKLNGQDLEGLNDNEIDFYISRFSTILRRMKEC